MGPIETDGFSGATEAERQRAAYKAVLGPGANHIRFMMKESGCRLQLRGAGDRDPSEAAPNDPKKEPLHLVVRPGIQANPSVVTEDQLDLVKWILNEIIENGSPSGLNDVSASTAKRSADMLASTAKRSADH